MKAIAATQCFMPCMAGPAAAQDAVPVRIYFGDEATFKTILVDKTTRVEEALAAAAQKFKLVDSVDSFYMREQRGDKSTAPPRWRASHAAEFASPRGSGLRRRRWGGPAGDRRAAGADDAAVPAPGPEQGRRRQQPAKAVPGQADGRGGHHRGGGHAHHPAHLQSRPRYGRVLPHPAGDAHAARVRGARADGPASAGRCARWAQGARCTLASRCCDPPPPFPPLDGAPGAQELWQPGRPRGLFARHDLSRQTYASLPFQPRAGRTARHANAGCFSASSRERAGPRFPADRVLPGDTVLVDAVNGVLAADGGAGVKLYLRKNPTATSPRPLQTGTLSRLLMTRMPLRIYCSFASKQSPDEFSNVLVSEHSTAASVLFAAIERLSLPVDGAYALVLTCDQQGRGREQARTRNVRRRREALSNLFVPCLGGNAASARVAGAEGVRQPARGEERAADQQPDRHPLRAAQGACALARANEHRLAGAAANPPGRPRGRDAWHRPRRPGVRQRWSSASLATATGPRKGTRPSWWSRPPRSARCVVVPALAL